MAVLAKAKSTKARVTEAQPHPVGGLHNWVAMALCLGMGDFTLFDQSGFLCGWRQGLLRLL